MRSLGGHRETKFRCCGKAGCSSPQPGRAKGFPGGALQVENCAASSAEDRLAPERRNQRGEQAADSQGEQQRTFQEGWDKPPWEQRRGPCGVCCHRNRRGCFLKFGTAHCRGGRRRCAPAGPTQGNLSAPQGAVRPPPAPGLCRPQPPPLARGPDPAAAREVPHSARSSDRWALTSATGRRQAGGESQQQRARCRRRPALHPSDCPGPRPRRSFPGRWARVALGTAAPPLGSALSGPHLCGLLVAESWDPRPKNRVFYRRQSPPSRPCIKPFRPARPGTSLRESRGAGPLPPGPPPALCSFERSRDPNTRVHSHACTPTDTAARAHAPAHTCTHTSQVHSFIRAHTLLTVTHLH